MSSSLLRATMLASLCASAAGCALPHASLRGDDASSSVDSMAPDDRAEPIDTGVAPMDVPSPIDTGVVARDTGVPPTDTGVPPMDTGVPPTDTGVPPMDTGVPPVDTGVPPTDTGVPPTDTGVPPTDTGVPPTDTGVPACGMPGQMCCGASCAMGSFCASGTCRACGGDGQPCCGSACNAGLRCFESGGMQLCGSSSGSCGAQFQPCCSPPNQCGSGLSCVANFCVLGCGAWGQVCCAGGRCNAGLGCTPVVNLCF